MGYHPAMPTRPINPSRLPVLAPLGAVVACIVFCGCARSARPVESPVSEPSVTAPRTPPRTPPTPTERVLEGYFEAWELQQRARRLYDLVDAGPDQLSASSLAEVRGWLERGLEILDAGVRVALPMGAESVQPAQETADLGRAYLEEMAAPAQQEEELRESIGEGASIVEGVADALLEMAEELALREDGGEAGESCAGLRLEAFQAWVTVEESIDEDIGDMGAEVAGYLEDFERAITELREAAAAARTYPDAIRGRPQEEAEQILQRVGEALSDAGGASGHIEDDEWAELETVTDRMLDSESPSQAAQDAVAAADILDRLAGEVESRAARFRAAATELPRAGAAAGAIREAWVRNPEAAVRDSRRFLAALRILELEHEDLEELSRRYGTACGLTSQ